VTKNTTSLRVSLYLVSCHHHRSTVMQSCSWGTEFFRWQWRQL